MIIDGHAHAAGEYATVESILALSRKHDIASVVLCTSPKNNRDLKEPPSFPFLKSPRSIFLLNRMLRFGYQSFLKDHGDGNACVFQLATQLPNLVIPFLWVDPLDPQHMDNLEECIHKYHPRGIKLHQAWDPFTINGSEVSQLVEVAQAKNLPIFIHLYSRNEAWKLLQFLDCHRNVTFIVAHMLGLDIFKEKHKDFSNLYFDTSGSERVRGVDILEAINCFGYDHVIFGSDTPYARIGDQIRKIESLNLTDTAMEHIFKFNIENIFWGNGREMTEKHIEASTSRTVE